MQIANEKILITGASGLLGHSLIKKLQSLKCSDIRTFRSKEYSLERENDVISLLNKNRDITVVFHLAAAVGGIIAHKENKAGFYAANTLMNALLVKHAQTMLQKLKKVCLVGSGACYSTNLPPPFKENDLWLGVPEPNVKTYGLVKRMLEIQSSAYREQFGFPSIVVHPGNSYGPHDHFTLKDSHVIPALIRKITDASERNNDKVVLFGTGKATRDFVYVDDLISAMITLVENYDSSASVNIASGEETSIVDLANKIKEIVGYRGRIEFDSTYPDGQPRRVFDITKLKSIIGDFPYTTLEQGLRSTIDWYQKSLRP